MKSPSKMGAIQIDITNVCVNRCSNCTRFCGHHKKPFFMDLETFKKAVDSFEDYEGVVGIIGGEPTLHPDFEKMVEYLREKRIGKKFELSRQPIPDMQEHILKNLYNGKSKIGLWSSLNPGYYRNFEVINDTFEYQLLNDHNNTCMHQAILMSRKELGISDEEWPEIRDNCFAQNEWSATITPKGAFFCEIAGAFDMLFNGPGGWPIEKGWYNRGPKDFGDQLQWCELCSLCLDVPQRISCDEHDDVTPLIYEKLKEIESPKMAAGLCVQYDASTHDRAKYKSFSGATDYMEAGGNIRTTKENRNLYPKKFTATNKKNLLVFLKEEKPKDWIIISDNKKKTKNLIKYLSDVILNPGCLYKYDNCIIFNVLASSIRNYIKNPDAINSENIESFYPSDKIIGIKIKTSKWYQTIFSIKNVSGRKIITILGIKIKLKKDK